ncbi:cyclic nucleotide-binding domain-containing protein [Oxalobacteraceae bacterium CAVE-383]|nr:cyclic nucleotide-binding domain-containing protein [Oxalobacteraceae bacterium CAVE-383]
MILSKLLNRWNVMNRHPYSAIKLFSTLSAKELRNLNPVLHHRSYIKEEVVFDKGEAGQAVYFVLEGSVTLQRPLADGNYTLSHMACGDAFGTLALLLDEPRAFQAVAQTDCRLAVLFRSDLQLLLETQTVTASKIHLAVAKQLARILHDAALDDTQLISV